MDVPINKEPRWLWDTMHRYRLHSRQLFRVLELITNNPPLATHLTSVSHINDLAVLRALRKLNGELLNLCSYRQWVEAYILLEIYVSGQPIDPAFHDQLAVSKHLYTATNIRWVTAIRAKASATLWKKPEIPCFLTYIYQALGSHAIRTDWPPSCILWDYHSSVAEDSSFMRCYTM
jgi:hypothetical protein